MIDHLQGHHILPLAAAAGDPLIPGAYFDDPVAPRHGVAGVHHQIDQGVFQLANVYPCRPRRRLRLNLQA